MNLTTHIVLRPQINPKQTLTSLARLKNNILTVDLGTSKDLAVVRNQMLQESKTDWNLYIEPWEILMPDDDIESLINGRPHAYRMTILSGESIRKEVRLWHKGLNCSFVNPIFETLKTSIEEFSCSVIWENKIDRQDELKELLGCWEKSQPFSQDMKYFKALQSLTAGSYKEFVGLAKQCLLQQKKVIACSMLRYYLGVISCLELNFNEAIQQAAMCIAANPLMAEFWCLLGDIFFKANDLTRAECFYNNAKILGARRLNDDAWPMHIPKYEEYPSLMIQKCKIMPAE
jgi:tetratricopeptide (TPR) repeat protein